VVGQDYYARTGHDTVCPDGQAGTGRLMGFLDRFRAGASPSATAPTSALPILTFHAVRETYPFTADDGTTIWASGYTLLDDATGTYVKLHEQHLDNPHCLLCRVAGTSHRRDALQDERFAPGSPVTLRPEPTNPYDRNAVGVWDDSGTLQIGFVPAEHSERIAADMRSGSQLGGVMMREFRRAENGPRVGLHMLIVPAGSLRMEIESDDEDEDEYEDEEEDRTR